MKTRDKSRSNGPVVTYRFKSEELRDLYNKREVTLEEAREEVPQEPFMEQVTVARSKQLVDYLRNYCYPEAIKLGAKRFIILSQKTGEVTIKRYLYLYQLLELVSQRDLKVYITNIE